MILESLLAGIVAGVGVTLWAVYIPWHGKRTDRAWRTAMLYVEVFGDDAESALAQDAAHHAPLWGSRALYDAIPLCWRVRGGAGSKVGHLRRIK